MTSPVYTANRSAVNTLTTGIELEFDYSNDVCNAKVIGGDGAGDIYEKSFSLNGSKFKTLKYYTTRDKENATISYNSIIAYFKSLFRTVFTCRLSRIIPNTVIIAVYSK